jgi:hypothetical protein
MRADGALHGAMQQSNAAQGIECDCAPFMTRPRSCTPTIPCPLTSKQANASLKLSTICAEYACCRCWLAVDGRGG